MKNEIIDDERESFVCLILGYKIHVDSRQFIVRSPSSKKDKNGKPKDGSIFGFYRRLSDALEDIRDTEIRLNTQGSKTLEVAIDKMIEFDKVFEKLLEPLKKIQRY